MISFSKLSGVILPLHPSPKTPRAFLAKLKWISKSILIAIPIHKHQKHVVVINVSERFWMLPARWIDEKKVGTEEKPKLMERVINRATENRGCLLHPTDIRETTYVLIGRWPDYVCRGEYSPFEKAKRNRKYVKKFARRGDSNVKKAIYVYNGKKGEKRNGKGYFSFDYVEMFWKHIHKFYNSRYLGLLKSTNGTPYGTAAEIEHNLRSYLNSIYF